MKWSCAKHTSGCGHLTVDVLRLEEYVFDSAICALEHNDRWKQRQSTRDDSTRHQEEAALEARKADLLAQAERVRSAFIIDGEALMPEAEMLAHLKRINDDVANIHRRIGELLGSTVLAEAVAEGLDWRSWNVPRRRNFLRILVARLSLARGLRPCRVAFHDARTLTLKSSASGSKRFSRRPSRGARAASRTWPQATGVPPRIARLALVGAQRPTAPGGHAVNHGGA